MNAEIRHGKVVHVAAPLPVPATGPVSIPDLRIEDDLLSGVRLALGPVDTPTMTCPCASREVAERTQKFFGGNRP